MVEEPLGGLSYARGDVAFDNTTKRFTWGVSDTIGTSLKPRRPIKLFMGFKVLSQDKNIPFIFRLIKNVTMPVDLQLILEVGNYNDLHFAKIICK